MKVARVENEWQKAAAYYVRTKTMVEGEGVSYKTEFDDDNIKNPNYYLIYDGDRPVGTCRVNRLDNKTAKIERVIILTEYQNKGFGSELILKTENFLKKDGITTVIIDSRDKALHFYERLGYRVIEDRERVAEYNNLIENSHKTIKENRQPPIFECILTEKTISGQEVI